MPAKFQLKKAGGAVVSLNTLPQCPTPAAWSRAAAAVDESIYTDTGTSGATYRADPASQQYAYNWSTKGAKSGLYYRVGVTLDDGSTHYVNIGLR